MALRKHKTTGKLIPVCSYNIGVFDHRVGVMECGGSKTIRNETFLSETVSNECETENRVFPDIKNKVLICSVWKTQYYFIPS